MAGSACTRRVLPWLLSFLLISALTGCFEAPVPAEADLADTIDRALSGAGASLLLTDDYCRWQADLFLARAHFDRERERVWPFRDMDRVKAEFSAVTLAGNTLLVRVEETRAARARAAAARLAEWKDRLADQRRITTLMNEGRLARSHIVQAELLLQDAERAMRRGDHDRVDLILTQVALHGNRSDSALAPIVSRYSDRSQIARWRGWVQETIEEARRDGGMALVVFKLDKKLVVYRGGKPYRSFRVGLGANGLSDKRQSGDDATPEGRYHITRKNPASHYYKALLFNYPNDEDRRQYALAKRRGQISPGCGIGGLVEIHGGGVKGMTYGCISMDNRDIDLLYELVDVGTPITIVGTIEGGNPLAANEREPQGG